MRRPESRGHPAPTALVVAHPGHELRVFGWMERVRPTVFVLTDGSGSTAQSRLDATARLLAATGARRGSMFGRFTDRALYSALIDGRTDVLLDATFELADALRACRIEVVAGDAAEGFNPGHDVCRFILDAAVRLAADGASPLRNLEFSLVDAPGAALAGATDVECVELDSAALARKLAAAGAYEELRAEVDQAIARFGADAFAREVLAPARTAAAVRVWDDDPPFYERHGLHRVTEGVYDRALTWADHVRPACEALLLAGVPA